MPIFCALLLHLIICRFFRFFRIDPFFSCFFRFNPFFSASNLVFSVWVYFQIVGFEKSRYFAPSNEGNQL